MIPKIIHYCWFGKKPFPKSVLVCLENWEKTLPDYKFQLWNEENFPINKTFVKNAYKKKKFAFVADYARLSVLYDEGGVYLDTDMFLLKNIDKLLENYCFLGYEDDTYIAAGIIGATPHNKFIKACLDSYSTLNFSKIDVDSMLSITIPKVITENYHLYELKSELKTYPPDYFYSIPSSYSNVDPNEIDNYKNYFTENSYAVHLWARSWVHNSPKQIDEIYILIRKIIKVILRKCKILR